MQVRDDRLHLTGEVNVTCRRQARLMPHESLERFPRHVRRVHRGKSPTEIVEAVFGAGARSAHASAESARNGHAGRSLDRIKVLGLEFPVVLPGEYSRVKSL